MSSTSSTKDKGKESQDKSKQVQTSRGILQWTFTCLNRTGENPQKLNLGLLSFDRVTL